MWIILNIFANFYPFNLFSFFLANSFVCIKSAFSHINFVSFCVFLVHFAGNWRTKNDVFSLGFHWNKKKVNWGPNWRWFLVKKQPNEGMRKLWSFGMNIYHKPIDRGKAFFLGQNILSTYFFIIPGGQNDDDSPLKFRPLLLSKGK